MAAMAPKLSNLLSTVAVMKILEMKLCAFMRNGQFLRKSIFFITKQTWLREKKMADYKNAINPVLWQIVLQY